MMDILQIIDKLKELDYDEVELAIPDFELRLKRSGSPIVAKAQESSQEL